MKWRRGNKIVYRDGAHIKQQLEAKVIELRSEMERRSVETVYVDRPIEKTEILYKEDTELLAKYNAAAKEVEYLKANWPKPVTIEKEVIVEKIVVKTVINWNYISIASLVSGAVGYILCFIR